MNRSSRLRFDIEDAPVDADVEVLPNGLEAFNEGRWQGHQPWRPLAVFARDLTRDDPLVAVGNVDSPVRVVLDIPAQLLLLYLARVAG